jgi:hypothetical protein
MEHQLDATITILNQLNMFGQFFAHLQERKTVVYSSVVYCPSHRTHSLRRRTPDLQPTTT